MGERKSGRQQRQQRTDVINYYKTFLFCVYRGSEVETGEGWRSNKLFFWHKHTKSSPSPGTNTMKNESKNYRKTSLLVRCTKSEAEKRNSTKKANIKQKKNGGKVTQRPFSFFFFRFLESPFGSHSGGARRVNVLLFVFFVWFYLLQFVVCAFNFFYVFYLRFNVSVRPPSSPLIRSGACVSVLQG